MRVTRWGSKGTLAVALALGLAACGGDDERQEGGCTPGSIEACYCVDGAAGSHTCDPQGHGYSDCDCRPVEDDVPADADVTGADTSLDAADVQPPDPGVEVAEGGLDVPADAGSESPAELLDEPRPEATEVADEGQETAGPDACAADCAGKACGPDGCGGSCGDCPGAGVCLGGECLCVPDCQDKTCGADGCGGSCGSCEAGFLCSGEQRCEKDCTPVPVTPCQVLFSAPVTSPVSQEYVWVTGSFTGWAESLEAGAVALAHDTVAGDWRGLVSVPAGPFEFKYLVKWVDGAQQWCVVSEAGAFECAAAAANQAGTSTCGVTNPCVLR